VKSGADLTTNGRETGDAQGVNSGVREAALRLVARRWRMLIDGELVDAVDGTVEAAVNPADETVVATFPAASAADVDRAVAAAAAAAPAWAATGIGARAALLGDLADAIERHGEELAWIDTVDNGSPIAVMRGDYRLAVEQLRYFAGLALQLRGETIPVDGRNTLDFTLREPFGIVGRIVPFNHPLMFAASRIAAPLLAGNSVILKPAELTSLSGLRMAELAAGIFPPGVLNVVTGLGQVAGERLVTHPDVPRIAFTGSEMVGRRIQAQAASAAVKTVTLELGGKNPLIVFPDADVEEAVEGALRGMNFTWQGQSCGSTSRLLVHRSVYHEVLAELGRRIALLRVGDPLDEATDVGPLVSDGQRTKVARYIKMGLRDPGLDLIAGGEICSGPGYFVRPTLFAADNRPAGPLFTAEIFGPVLVAAPFDGYDEAIAVANGLPFGLTASVWTTDLATAMAAARDLHAGYVWINWSSSHLPGTAFGGVKNSGVGREEGIEELQSFTQSKNVYIRF
jgi:betaine-aldehyde dehydrogenase